MTRIQKITYTLTLLAVSPFAVAWVLNCSSALKVVFGVDLEIDWLARLVFFDSLPGAVQDLITVDLSTVTTGLILITSVFLARGFLPFLQPKNGERGSNKKSREHFPFWPTYKTTFVQLGLAGTLFAFIVAFGNAKVATDYGKHVPEKIEQRSTSVDSGGTSESSLTTPSDTSALDNSQNTTEASIILLDALGTALWSTFSAIMLAFVICPIIEAGFRKRLQSSEHDGPTPPDSDRSIDKEIDDVAASFSDLGKGVNAAKTEITELAGTIKNLSDAGKLKEFLADTSARVSALENQTKIASEELSTYRGRLQRLELAGDSLKNGQDATESRLKVLEETSSKHQKLKRALSNMMDALR